MKEQEIVQLLKDRKQQGIEELLRYYGPLMRYVISPIVNNAEDVEECLNEAAMRVWEKIDLYDAQRGGWNSWLTALTRNVAINKAKAIQKYSLNNELSETLSSTEPSPEEAVIQQERKDALLSALNVLSKKDRVIFYRKYYYMQSTIQIASELGMSNRAVEGKLYRIKKRLRKILGGGEYV